MRGRAYYLNNLDCRCISHVTLASYPLPPAFPLPLLSCSTYEVVKGMFAPATPEGDLHA